MELVLIEIGSKEWQFIWEWLSNNPINKDIENPSLALNEGEGWQYLGSYKQGERILHSLRHRCHPINNSVVSLTLSASKDFTPDQIQKKYKL